MFPNYKKEDIIMFCQKCGAQVPENSGFCSACGAPTTASGANQTSGFGSTATATAPAAPNKFVTYLKDVWAYVVAFFKQDPSAAMNKAAHDTNPVWYGLVGGMWLLGFGMMMALIQGVGSIKIAGNYSINSMLSEAKNYASSYNSSYSMPGSLLEAAGFFRVLLFSLLLIGGTFAVKAVGTWVCATKIAKIDVKLPNVLNALGVAELPMVATFVVSTILGFIWFEGAVVLLFAGSVMSYIMLYEVVKTTGMCGEKPTWIITLLLAVVVLVFWLLMGFTLNGIMGGIMQSFGQSGDFGFGITDMLGSMDIF